MKNELSSFVQPHLRKRSLKALCNSWKFEIQSQVPCRWRWVGWVFSKIETEQNIVISINTKKENTTVNGS